MTQEWALAHPDEGYVVTPISEANLSRLISVHETETDALAARLVAIDEEIEFHEQAIQALRAQQ
jgi:hypothetical protein